MATDPLPSIGAWRHIGLREGFEVAFFESRDGQFRLRGSTAAVEGDDAWAVHYLITLDGDWLTRTAEISGWSGAGASKIRVACDASGRWTVDGASRPDLDGCTDLDLESSAVTNTIPVHRLDLAIGASAEAPAAYVRAGDLRVERLEQRYERTAQHDGLDYHYEAPRFDFECLISYDTAGLVVSYPGIAVRTK